MSAEARLRLTILGGYLGAGKTTWLRHQLHARAFGQVHVIVNEAAGTPVDDALLGADGALTLLAGGCACCTGRDALTAALLGLCDTRSKGGDARLGQIVLETSGLADPGAIIALVQAHPVLTRQIVVAETVVVVDAVHAADQLAQEALSRAQIEAADRLVLTKTGQADPRALARLVATLRALAPGAVLSAAEFGSAVPLPDLPPAPPLPLPALAGAQAPVAPVALALGDMPDWAALSVWLSALLFARGDSVVRVKGVVRTPAGRLLVQTVRQIVQSPEVLPDTPAPTDNTLVLIGRGLTAEAVAASYARFAG